MVKGCIQPWYQSTNAVRMWCNTTEYPQNMLRLMLKSLQGPESNRIPCDCVSMIQRHWQDPKILHGGLCLLPCCPNLIPNRATMFQTPRKSWDCCFLHRNIYQTISLQIGDQPHCYHAEEDLSFNIKNMITTENMISLWSWHWNENTTCPMPYPQNWSLFPYNYHKLR